MKKRYSRLLMPIEALTDDVIELASAKSTKFNINKTRWQRSQIRVLNQQNKIKGKQMLSIPKKTDKLHFVNMMHIRKGGKMKWEF